MQGQNLVNEINSLIKKHKTATEDNSIFGKMLLKAAGVEVKQTTSETLHCEALNKYLVLKVFVDTKEQELKFFNFLSNTCSNQYVHRDVLISLTGEPIPFTNIQRYIINAQAAADKLFPIFKDTFVKQNEINMKGQELIEKIEAVIKASATPDAETTIFAQTLLNLAGIKTHRTMPALMTIMDLDEWIVFNGVFDTKQQEEIFFKFLINICGNNNVERDELVCAAIIGQPAPTQAFRHEERYAVKTQVAADKLFPLFNNEMQKKKSATETAQNELDTKQPKNNLSKALRFFGSVFGEDIFGHYEEETEKSQQNGLRK